MYDYITPQKPLDALKFLKANNPVYAHIEVNEQWFNRLWLMMKSFVSV